MTVPNVPESARSRTAPARVLCVDDDPSVLRALRRVLGARYDVTIAVGALAGLEAVRTADTPYAVIITDLRMPDLSGVGLLQCVRQQSPDTVRVLLTGYADVTSSVEAVNAGEVFRFLTKPCTPDTLLDAAAAACAAHRRLVTAASPESGEPPDATAAVVEVASTRFERDGTRGDVPIAVERPPRAPSLVSAARAEHADVPGVVQHPADALPDHVAVLSAMLAAVHPAASDCAARVEWRVGRVLRRLPLGVASHVRAAAALSQLGAVRLPHDVVERIYGADPLSGDDRIHARRIRPGTSELLENAGALALVRRIIGTGASSEHEGRAAVADDELVVGARVVDVACAVDECLRQRRDVGPALELLRRREGDRIASVVDAFRADIDAHDVLETRVVRLRDAKPEMILAGDVYAPNGLLVACRGQRIRDVLAHRLSALWSDTMRALPIAVAEPDGGRLPSGTSLDLAM